MDIDLHCHAKLSKGSSFNIKHFLKIKKSALRNGLQAIALTEHFDTNRFTEIYEVLEQHYQYQNDYFNIEGLKVFCGMEVDIKEGGHVLLIGKREDVLSLHKELSPFLAGNTYPSLEYLTEEANKREMIKIGAHPLRNDNPLGKLPDTLLKKLDFLELNGKDIKKSSCVFQLAERLDLPVVAGSDTHLWLQVGCVRNRLDKDCTTVSQIKAALEEGKYDTCITSGINIKLSCAKIAKKILKKLSARNRTDVFNHNN